MCGRYYRRSSSPRSDRQLTSFHQQSTTTSPQENDVQPPVFAKTPAKTRSTTAKKIQQKRFLFGQILRFSRDDYGSDHFVLGSSREPWPCPIRANSPPTENGPAMSQTPGNEIYPEKIASSRSLILRGFSRVLREAKAEIKHAGTEWRRVRDSNPR
jgi:hypothetical protein